MTQATDVYIDGEYFGQTEEPDAVREKVLTLRRNGDIHDNVNIHYSTDRNEIRVLTDEGRVRRPVIIVEDGEPAISDADRERLKAGELTIQDLVEKGVIEYLDAEEEESAYVALYPEDVTEDHTHLELDPAITHGLSSSLVSYANFNRGDRVNYGAKMVGQGIGLPATNFHMRYDTRSNVLMYGQKPIVDTQTSDTLIGDHPVGQNMVVAISSFEGYNMEDGVIFNKAAIERGLARSYHFRTYTSEASRYWGGQRDEITVPDKDVRGYRSEEAYNHLSSDGIVNHEAHVESGDVIVGKTSPPKFLGSSEEVRMGLAAKRETSSTVRHGESGNVDSVMLSESDDGDKLIKVRLRQERIPELGDKFATRHGQKGVIGLIVPQEDMPFTKDGIVPDLILSTHAIPSRMTVSQLMEVIGGKTAALRGSTVDGTAFDSEPAEQIQDELLQHGFQRSGKEQMYNGITGEQLDANVLIGPAYYLKLSHMVADKVHARSRGPVTLLTKQPTAGRAREGGLRLGEMEKDCFIGHGSSLLLKERFGSDMVTAHICNDCGHTGMYDRRDEEIRCQQCDSSDLEKTRLPQAYLLLLNELKSLLISPTMEVDA